MHLKKKILFFKVILLVFIFQSALSQGNDICKVIVGNIVLYVRNSNNFTQEPNQTDALKRLEYFGGRMLQNHELFYADNDTIKSEKKSFIVSNEWDIYNLPTDLGNTDFFIGFGNNSSWDLAQRMNPQSYFIADRALEPLITQRYFFKLLFKISNSPAAFKANFTSPDKAIQAIKESKNISEQERREYLEFFTHFINTYPTFPISTGHIQDINSIGRLLSYRYSYPADSDKSQTAEIQRHPNYSFMSSQAAYDTQKKLMENVQLAKTDYADPAFWDKVAENTRDKKSDGTYTIYLSNILDFVSDENEAVFQSKLLQFKTMIIEKLKTKKIKLIITRRLSFPHDFEIHNLESQTVEHYISKDAI